MPSSDSTSEPAHYSENKIRTHTHTALTAHTVCVEYHLQAIIERIGAEQRQTASRGLEATQTSRVRWYTA